MTWKPDWGDAVTSEDRSKIISLTYHEITADPRVLKQARVLQKNGYAVNVFCDLPEGMPEHDTIDGVEVTRFRCYHPSGVTKAAFDEMNFLNQAREAVARKFLPYARECQRLEEMRPFLQQKFGDDVLERAQSSYFKQSSGSERKRRLLEYLYLNLRLLLFRTPAGSGTTQKRGVDVMALGKLRRKLFQVDAIVYHANFPDLDPEQKYLAVHAHDIYCLPAGVMLSKKLGVPLVYDAHEYEPARATKIDVDAPGLPEALEDDCFGSVSRMITVSEGIAALYAKRFAGPAPTIVMNAPEIDTTKLQEDVVVPAGLKTVREQADLGDDVPLVVFTGLIQREHRGLDKVLNAMAHLPDAHLVSLGPRNRGDDRWFLRMAEQLGLSKRVHLLPPVDARDVPAAISSAHLSVCPFQDVSLNHRLAMPNKLFEAAFARIPICVSDLPEMKRFVERLGIGRVMDQTDPKAIAAAFQDVFDNREDYLMGPQAERELFEVYSWQAQSEKLLALYHDLIGEPAARYHEAT